MRKVLVVDDNEINQDVARAMLQKCGCDCQVVANGLEAVDAAAATTFDLILIDCQMPEMDGFEATARIRRDEAATGRRVPIVALTADAIKGDRERCLSVGMDDYLAKPVKLTSLMALLRRIQAAPTAPAAVPPETSVSARAPFRPRRA